MPPIALLHPWTPPNPRELQAALNAELARQSWCEAAGDPGEDLAAPGQPSDAADRDEPEPSDLRCCEDLFRPCPPRGSSRLPECPRQTAG